MNDLNLNKRLYLVSDSTGDTVSNITRAALSHFNNIKLQEQKHSFVDNTSKIDHVIEEVKNENGLILYTIADAELTKYIEKKCKLEKLECIEVLSKTVNGLEKYLNIKATAKTGKIHELNEKYFSKIDALNYAISHDDGQNLNNIYAADIIIIGVSRTSKSPTSFYIAQKGIKVANIPFVSSISLPKELFEIKDKFIIGLTISADNLIEIRKKRVISYNIHMNNKYISLDEVTNEIKEAKRVCYQNNWDVIDVTKRSVEETAALIVQKYEQSLK